MTTINGRGMPPRVLSWLLAAATCFAGYLAFQLLRESQVALGILLAIFALLTAVLAVAAAILLI